MPTKGILDWCAPRLPYCDEASIKLRAIDKELNRSEGVSHQIVNDISMS